MRKWRLRERERSGQQCMTRTQRGQSQSAGGYVCKEQTLFCPFFFPAPSLEHKGLFLSASVSPLSLSQPDSSDGHRRDKDVLCTSPQAGHLPLDASPAGPTGELAAGASSPTHPSQCHILCRWSYRPPSPCTLPAGTAQARGQSTEVSPHCLPSPGHSQAWGFSIGLERGGVTGRGP